MALLFFYSAHKFSRQTSYKLARNETTTKKSWKIKKVQGTESLKLFYVFFCSEWNGKETRINYRSRPEVENGLREEAIRWVLICSSVHYVIESLTN